MVHVRSCGRPSPTSKVTAKRGFAAKASRQLADTTLLLADGIDGTSVALVQKTLRAAGAVPLLIGTRIGPFKTAADDVMEAAATMENQPAVLFDALVLPEVGSGIE